MEINLFKMQVFKNNNNFRRALVTNKKFKRLTTNVRNRIIRGNKKNWIRVVVKIVDERQFFTTNI